VRCSFGGFLTWLGNRESLACYKEAHLRAPVVALASALTFLAGGVAETALRCDRFPVTIVGTEGSDRIVGTPRRDVISALGGDDVIRGLSGFDAICAGKGDDVVYGGPAPDRIYGAGGYHRNVYRPGN
jgi:Ca2+-binding RTX toxin-like protein